MPAAGSKAAGSKRRAPPADKTPASQLKLTTLFSKAPKPASTEATEGEEREAKQLEPQAKEGESQAGDAESNAKEVKSDAEQAEEAAVASAAVDVPSAPLASTERRSSPPQPRPEERAKPSQPSELKRLCSSEDAQTKGEDGATERRSGTSPFRDRPTQPQVDVTPDSGSKNLSLRERLLLRKSMSASSLQEETPQASPSKMPRVGAGPKDNQDKGENTPESGIKTALRERLLHRLGEVNASGSSIGDAAAKDHKKLGGLDFNWALLFHQGTRKPNAKKPEVRQPRATANSDSGPISKLATSTTTGDEAELDSEADMQGLDLDLDIQMALEQIIDESLE